MLFVNSKLKSIKYLAVFCSATLALNSATHAETLTSTNIQISDKFITLGDIFNVSEELAETKLFQAPPLGRKGNLSVAMLNNISAKYELSWDNADNVKKVSVSRLASVVNAEEIKTLIRDYAISNKHIANSSGQTRVKLHDKFKDLLVAQNEYANFEIREFIYRPFNDQFNASFEYTFNDVVKKFSVTGKIENLVRIPVLANNVRREETIRYIDIKYIQMNNRRIAQNIILDAEEIIGKAAKSSIRANQPIADHLLKYPNLVKQNTIISLNFNLGRIKLNIKARALMSGAKDSLIRVMNLKSGKQIDAIVTGKDQAMTINSINQDAKKIASN